jgi:hypothetical protein
MRDDERVQGRVFSFSIGWGFGGWREVRGQSDGYQYEVEMKDVCFCALIYIIFELFLLFGSSKSLRGIPKSENRDTGILIAIRSSCVYSLSLEILLTLSPGSAAHAGCIYLCSRIILPGWNSSLALNWSRNRIHMKDGTAVNPSKRW